MRSAAIILAFVAAATAVGPFGGPGGPYAGNWDSAQGIHAANLARNAAANAAQQNHANANWAQAQVANANANPRWACAQNPSACAGDHYAHAPRFAAPVGHPAGVGHGGFPGGLWQGGYPGGRFGGYAAYAAAPADPRTLWACAQNPSACTRDVTWASGHGWSG